MPEETRNVPDRDAFAVHRATVRDGVELAFVREGVGGVPILLCHGWPGTKRIFYRNIGPLAEAGFEVVAPDVRGWGDSPVPPPSRYADAPSTARDFKALMEHLGHERWITAAFDFGSVSAQEMAHRFPECVIRQVLWNSLVPNLPEEYEAAGVGGDAVQEVIDVSAHPFEHGDDTDAFVEQFATDAERQAYVASFYQGRVWKPGGPVRGLAAMGSFDDEAAAFHAEAFADAAVFRSSLHFYSTFMHPELFSEMPLFHQRCHTETMQLWGIEDQLVSAKSPRRASIGYPNLVGPFLVEGGGHFLSWERPDVVNSAIICFCRDLLGRH